jgi:predicted lactoylglutathione lyase
VITVERTDFVSVPVTDLERSTRFAGETFDTGVCHMAHFHDPDGNTLMLHRRYAPHED